MELTVKVPIDPPGATVDVPVKVTGPKLPVPFKVASDITKPEILAIDPVIQKVPPVTWTFPELVLSPVKVKIPLPSMLRSPGPLKDPARVCVSGLDRVRL